MFKVECPACNAPYQVDERRVPASGLKMRCPKCGSSFHLQRPGTDPARAAVQPPAAPGPIAPAQRSPAQKKKMRGTMIGVAPPTASKAARPQPPPAVVEAAKPPEAGSGPPSSPVAPGRGDLFEGLDLPAVSAPRPFEIAAPAPPEPDLDLPAARAPARHAPAFGELDLPLPAESARAPAPLDDLPDLPPAQGDLPAAAERPRRPIGLSGLRVDADLPSRQEASLPMRQEASLPMRQEASLPMRQEASLPMRQEASLPMRQEASLPALHGDLPDLAMDSPFGDIELPSVGADLPTFGTELPSTVSPSGRAPYGDLASPFDDLDAAPMPGAERRNPAYGEVSLDDDGGAIALDRSDTGQTGAPSPDARARSKRSQRRAPAERAGKRRLGWIVGGLAAATIGGSALTLVPSVGPFGAYFLSDLVQRGDHERLLAGTAAAARARLGLDTYTESQMALAEIESASGRAKRFRPLAAYAAFAGFSRVLRFGAEASAYARAKIALDQLAEVSGVLEVDLARAARAAADSDIARARKGLDDLGRAAPKNVDAAVLRGEVELRAKDAPAAVVAWKTALSLEASARTKYGLARAQILRGDAAAAEALGAEVLSLSPGHVGARILLSEIAWGAREDEARATSLLGEVTAAIDRAGPEEQIGTYTLLGEIHVARGRMSQADQAFGEAIRVAESVRASARAARALAGQGDVLFVAGRYSQAIARYQGAVQADPDNVAAQVGVLKCSLLLERLEEAKGMAARIRKAYPTSFGAAYWAGRVAEALGERKDAEAAYRGAIEIGQTRPQAIDAYVALATLMSAAGEYDAANAVLAEAQAKLPASTALHKALGRAALSQGRYADALAAFVKARELTPGDLEARFLEGTAYTRLREFGKALEIFDAVGKADRDFPGLALERGTLFQESGRAEDAVREYEAALAKAPNDPDLMLKVGCGKAAAGAGIEEAEKLLRQVALQRTAAAEPHFCLGRALMAKQDLGDAIAEFERAAQIDPNRAEYHLYVGWASNLAGAAPKAAAALKRALELDRGLADAYWQRGALRVRQTRPKDAIEDLTRALELRPTRVEAHADLALAYYDLGQEDRALDEWQKAVAARPDEPTWRFQYGKLLNLRLQNAAAAEQLQKAIELAATSAAPPAWLPEAHRLAALSLGNTRAAIPHWQAFLKTGPTSSPYRNEAKTALRRLGAKWDE